ncbi:hypothetical protein BCR43DRAFT_436317 [Syncephalastrum racemosum]|uniref:START domain-containing protein n=1 Tax=Syncephalastrum racemosum TaxID=13706 RepID=A0A1X2HI02_SYNRA|nr:hypothetical protein BCR43DRAFT_436317 [Syncephalastrum racemosum]
MAIIENENRHSAASRKALSYLKELCSSLDGFDFKSEKNGVKLYSRVVPGNPVDIVRGETVLKTTELSPRDLASMATEPGIRATWDEKFDTSELIEFFTPVESLFWCRLKTPWPISNRDVSGVCLRDLEDDVCYISMSSVEDAKIPAKSGCVRANLMVSGWKFAKVESGVAITYITQVDLAGSIPISFVKNVQQQVPLCAGTLAECAQTYGFPPYTVPGTANVKMEHFDMSKRTYTVTLDGTEAEHRIVTSSKMYTSGVKVVIDGTASHQIVDDRNNKAVVISGINDTIKVTISKV